MNYNYKSKDSILEHANKLIGKSFGEIDKYNRLEDNKGKGNLGQVVEESHFEYEVNTKSEADFSYVGL